jgi:putative nucleotidyltransferase with HDIG domain
MDVDSAERRSLLQRLKAASLSARLWAFFVLGIVGTVVALSLPLSGGGLNLALNVNEVAPQDITAPYALSYTSDVLTEQARQAAADAVPNMYDPPDVRVARQQVEKLQGTLTFIDSLRNDPTTSRNQALASLESSTDIRLDAQTAKTILDMPDSSWEAVKVEAVSVLERVMRSEIREGQMDEARRAVPALVSVSLPEDQANLVATLASAFMAPNSAYNDAATRAARADARQGVPPVAKSYAAGQTIVRQGEIVTPLQLETLSAYGLLKPPEPWKNIAVRTLLATLLASAVTLYAYRVHPSQLASARLTGITCLLFIVIAVTLEAMIPGRTVLPYLFPSATLPMLMAVLFGPGMGVLSAVATGALAGYLGARGLELALYMTFSGVLAALVVGRAERLSTFFWAGLAASLAAIAVVVVFRFPDPGTDTLGKASLLAAALVSGLLSASIGFGLLLLIGNLLGITTNLQLIELSRPDHPLLQFILRNAPGTYQHSLQVANFAEQAARAIGANTLLTRVGALYHDAGKALRPSYFIENQPPGQNVHQQLDPATSAGVILAHVQDGLELARKHHLPRSIRAFIPEHHGTLEATFQYRAALEAAGGDTSRVDRRDFVYPGPRPRSREAAILMLADGIEAKARAEPPEDDGATERLVAWVIQDRLSKGQLDRTDLTLRDLDTIRRAFISALKGVYHPRIRYPEPRATPEVAAPEAEARPAPLEGDARPQPPSGEASAGGQPPAAESPEK